MDQLTQMLKQLNPAELERLLQQVKQDKPDDSVGEPSETSPAEPHTGAVVAQDSTPPALVSQPIVNEEATTESPPAAISADVPLSDLFASSGDAPSGRKEKLRQLDAHLNKEADKASEREKQREEKLRKEAEKALEKERAHEEKVKREAEKALEKERLTAEKVRRELEKAVLKLEKDEEKERQKLEKDEERDSQKLFKDAEKEEQKVAKEVEREHTRAQKLEEARQTAASKAAANPPTASLSAFGFFAQTAKQSSEAANILFPPFVPDRRIVPAALCLWQPSEERKSTALEEEASVLVTDGPAHATILPCVDEESSLMHAPVGAHVDATADLQTHCAAKRSFTFNDMIEGAVGDNADTCPCAYHTHAVTPVDQFNSEVVLAGFYAIGYDPCQSRPPYFGTLNHLQEGNLNRVELLRLGRFPANQDIPRLSTLDYEYDSGDDWDVLEDDEDIAASSSDSDDEIASLDSSDRDFIDDDDDDSDPDCELQRKIVEARQRRAHRLAGKDKLIPSYSGPFVHVQAAEHPLSHCDCLDRFRALNDEYFEAMLETELARLHSTFTHGADSEAKREQKLLEAALKNRREMLEDELEAMHKFIAINSKVSPKMVADALHEQHLCAGVARAEITRSIKRFYERKHGMLVRREEPWAATDDRLFVKAVAKKPKDSSPAAASKMGTAATQEQDNDADDEDGSDADQETSNGNADGAGAAPPPSAAPAHGAEASKCGGPTILELMDRKRGREEASDGAETEVVISVATTDTTSL